MYLKLGEKKYNLPDSVVIGRGEPFDIDDRSLARAHAKLVLKNGKFKIKDLGTDTGITVNGVRIKGGKFKSIELSDVVKLGNVPLELYESLPAQECTGVRKISIKSARDYSLLLYGALFFSAAAVTVLNSHGNYVSDLITLFFLAVVLKFSSVALRMARHRYYPFRNIHEMLVSTDGVTLYLSDGSNFSLRFHSIKRWHVVGKSFFIKAHGKDHRFLMLEDHEEFVRILKNKCLTKIHRGQVLFSWMGILPVALAILSVTFLFTSEIKILNLAGHFTGILGVLGLLAYLFIEDLRELVPIPWKLSRGQLSAAIVVVITATLFAQFNHFQGRRTPKELLAGLAIKRAERMPASLKPKK